MRGAAQLPLLVRGVFYAGWDPSKTPAKPRSKKDLLARIEARFDKDLLDDPERALTPEPLPFRCRVIA